MKTDLTKENLVAFATRDRSAIEKHRRSRWMTLEPNERLEITAALNEHLEKYCPTWNSKQSRIDDFEHHVKLSRMLRLEK